MAIICPLAVLVGFLSGLFDAAVVAQRDCSNATYPWAVTNADYVNEVSLSTAATNNGVFSFTLKQLDGQVLWYYLWSCAAFWTHDWPDLHDSEGGKALIWSGCTVTSTMMDVPAYDDMALSFAFDWPNRKIYLAHTHACKNREL